MNFQLALSKSQKWKIHVQIFIEINLLDILVIHFECRQKVRIYLAWKNVNYDKNFK